VDQAALLAALRAETLAALGPEALQEEPAEQDEASEVPAAPPPTGTRGHALFLLGLVLGGGLSALVTGEWALTVGLRGTDFARIVEALQVPAPLLLFFGGALVGFGTRMAGGCTSGHGLCGVSQFQPGSWLATAAFFGAGVGVSLALGALL
jgi:uncharacterized membrane protein YedE/YeeE